MHISRRKLTSALGVSAVTWIFPVSGRPRVRATASPSEPGITAAQVVDRIWARLEAEGVKRMKPTLDSFKAGDPNTPVHGIATVFMSTWDVLKRANDQGLNFVITHEPTFWSNEDDPAQYDNLDRTLYSRKQAWIEANKMIVWRLHDHWHMRRPDPMIATWVNRAGWGAYQQPDGRSFLLPETTLGTLVSDLRVRLKTRNIRVVGDPTMKVRTVSFGGHLGSQIVTAALTSDVTLVSEAREFDAFEFCRDCNELGLKRGLICIAHEQGEEYGMQPAESWVGSIAPEVPVHYIETGEAFWVP